jgi:membrane associated rhomboid family serine protease
VGLLAYLGVGEEHGNTDFMAHLWGFVSGVPLGGVARWGRWKERTPRWAQRLSALAAVALLGAAWWRAWR